MNWIDPRESRASLFAVLTLVVCCGWVSARSVSGRWGAWRAGVSVADPAATPVPVNAPAPMAAPAPVDGSSAESTLPNQSRPLAPPAAPALARQSDIENTEVIRATFVEPARRVEQDDAALEGRLRAAVQYLASDELAGRGLRTPGIELAAAHLVEQFTEIGLRTDLLDGSPYQQFAFGRGRPALAGSNRITLAGPGGDARPLELGVDFTPLSVSSSGSFDLPLVLVGYGIHAPELGYSDYEDVEVAGKAVVILRREPRQDDPDSVFNGTQYSEYAYFKNKITAAVRHGARAVVLCTESHSLAPSDSAVAAGGLPDDGDELLDFEIESELDERVVPVLQCRRHIVAAMVRAAAGTTLTKIERAIDADMTPRSVDLDGWRLSGEVTIREQRTSLKNVLGLLPGSGERGREVVVVGAHYDHLGRGGMNSLAPWTIEIHNGADDNASGTATMIEVARIVAQRGPLQRSVLFIGFTAEESGLVGSERYARNPLIPLERTVAMINLDMVGRLRQQLTINGTGTAATFPALVKSLGAKHGLTINAEPSGYGPSDYATFHERGVPVLAFFTGLHADYHRPSDDAATLNYPGMRQVTRMAADVVTHLANSPTRPSGEAGTEDRLVDTPPTRAPRRADDVSRGRIDLSREGSYLGVRIWPDDRAGYRITNVEPNSSADLGGLRVGDVLVEFDHAPVLSPDGLRDAVGRHAPGETVPAVIKRGEIDLEIQIPLRRR